MTGTDLDSLRLSKSDGLRVAGEVAATRLPVTFRQAANGVLGDATFFHADRAYTVVGIRASAETAATAATTLQVTKETGTQAPGAGVDLLATPFDLTTTANTVMNGSLATGAGVLDLAAGDRLGVDYSVTSAPLAGVSVTVMLKPKV